LSSRNEQSRLRDIVEFVDRATSYLDGMTVDQLAADDKSVMAIERCIQCITEAAIKIGEDRMTIIAPTVSMREVRGLGNRLRHSYDEVDLNIIYRTVTKELPILREQCATALDN
jgi:uncharacterized protein with HEPN domain